MRITLGFPCDGTSSAERRHCPYTAVGQSASRTAAKTCNQTLQQTDSGSNDVWTASCGQLKHLQLGTTYEAGRTKLIGRRHVAE